MSRRKRRHSHISTDSLGDFFDELGIRRLLTSEENGEGATQMVEITPAKLDGVVKDHSFMYPSYCHHLRSVTVFGETETPHFTAPDGVEYTFLSAVYDGRFKIETKITEPDALPHVRVLTIEELRTSIKPVPPSVVFV